MQAARGAFALAGMALFALTACGGGDPDLVRIKSTSNGPDEFSVVPHKPLEMPPSLNDLPAPTPGGVNRTELDPRGDAIAALGGNPNARSASSTDAALLTAAARYGNEAAIRPELAVEDAEFRNENRGSLLERVFRNTTYYRVYDDQMLNPQAEAQRWQLQGTQTPAAPPVDQ
ncbi:DUF3035 domain-containing protein [Falsirhodobacter sp. alg1]|uniref:DUF3035 domain-containing protein n=1 Tax=Falsirhodobacter sp. alg1 TaxID=1472418 RepID=UPI0007887C16|nr:DUF3035 domain-containing protein [Falsirhodobacter sp. alg1]